MTAAHAYDFWFDFCSSWDLLIIKSICNSLILLCCLEVSLLLAIKVWEQVHSLWLCINDLITWTVWCLDQILSNFMTWTVLHLDQICMYCATLARQVLRWRSSRIWCLMLLPRHKLQAYKRGSVSGKRASIVGENPKMKVFALTVLALVFALGANNVVGK